MAMASFFTNDKSYSLEVKFLLASMPPKSSRLFERIFFVSAISLDGFLVMPLEKHSGTSWASLAQPLSDGPKNG